MMQVSRCESGRPGLQYEMRRLQQFRQRRQWLYQLRMCAGIADGPESSRQKGVACHGQQDDANDRHTGNEWPIGDMLDSDQARLLELDAERRGNGPQSLDDQLERDYSPGRTWHSLAVGIAGLLDLGDVLDAGSGDGAAAGSLAPHCRSLTCVDTKPRSLPWTEP